MAYVTFTKAQAAKDAIQTINENFQLNGKRIKVQVVNSGYYDLNMEIDDDFLNNPSMRLSLMQKLMKDDQLESVKI
jgi:RNA-binding protein 23/39